MKETQKHWRGRAIWFLAGQSISLFGSQVVQMAIVWHVTLETGSGAWVAAFSVSAYLPQFFISFLGGVLADRYNRKKLILAADGVIAAVTLLMLLMMPCIAAERTLLAALLAMSAVRSAGAGIQTPAVNAAIVQLVPAQHRMRYNGVNAAMQAVVQFAAPAAAAVVLSVYSLRSALLIDVLTAMVGMGMLACLRLPETERAEKGAYLWAEMGTGIRYAYRCAAIRSTLTIYGLFLFLSVPAGYLAGLYVSRVYGDTVVYLTIVELVGFGGMLAGGLLMSLWGGFDSLRWTLATALAVFGAMAIGMGISGGFEAYLVCMLIYGVALTAVQTTITTMLQGQAEHAMQGRVFGLMSALYASCYPLGMALFGPLADFVPLEEMMIGSGIALILLAGAVCSKLHLHEEGKSE